MEECNISSKVPCHSRQKWINFDLSFYVFISSIYVNTDKLVSLLFFFLAIYVDVDITVPLLFFHRSINVDLVARLQSDFKHYRWKGQFIKKQLI